jgi:hypothetical protein
VVSESPEALHNDDLVEPEGINAGSSAAERDRRPDADVDIDASPVQVRPERDAPPRRDLVGTPGDEPAQQLGVGEG